VLEHAYQTLIADTYQKYDNNLQHGSFPLLKLPAELRDKIYHYHLEQYGRRRKSPYYKGTIETALLSTCRQVNDETRHIPLSTNPISFRIPFPGLPFSRVQGGAITETPFEVCPRRYARHGRL